MLTLGFFLVALIYATVGFGGGSSYLALLALAKVPYQHIPQISLICNLLVVTGGCWHYFTKGHFRKTLVLPLIAGSIPLAFIGGLYPITQQVFFILLITSLLLAGARLLFTNQQNFQTVETPKSWILFFVGAVLGLLSGLVGLGGGIFLAPIMLNLRWAKPKEVAAVASAFIFLNSSAGLAGQILKVNSVQVLNYWPLFVVVIIGGQIGSYLGAHSKFPQAWIQRLTALLIILIAARLLFSLF